MDRGTRRFLGIVVLWTLFCIALVAAINLSNPDFDRASDYSLRLESFKRKLGVVKGLNLVGDLVIGVLYFASMKGRGRPNPEQTDHPKRQIAG